MKNTLYQSLLNRLHRKHSKLAYRFEKGVKDGTFQQKGYAKRKASIERLKRLEARIHELTGHTGPKKILSYKHWALALAMGVVISVNAQKNEQTFKERIFQHAKHQSAAARTDATQAQTVFFSTPIDIGTPYINQVHFGDIDGDGDVDMIVAPYLTPPVVYSNNGDFTFTPEPITTNDLDIVFFTNLADFDSDGDLDIFMRNGNNLVQLSEQIFLNNGNGDFTPQTVTFPNTKYSDNVQFIGDLDEDGDADIVMRYLQPNPPYESPLVVFENENFNFSIGSYLNDPDDSSPSIVGLFDIDGDTDLDIVHTGYRISVGDALKFFTNDGSGNFTLSNNYVGLPSYIKQGTTSPFDFDNDGDLDFFAGNSNDVQVFSNDGNGLFNSRDTISFQVPGGIDEVFPFNTNSDQLEDFIVTFESDSTILFQSDGQGNFTQVSQLPASSVPANFDGDADTDLITIINNVALPLENDGSGGFISRDPITYIIKSNDADLVDIDGDGDLDIVQSDDYATLSILNDGIGNFSVSQSFQFDIENQEFGDLDGDGDIDLVAASADFGINIIANDGQGNLSNYSLVQQNYSINVIRLGDMDGDGDLDIVADIPTFDTYIGIFKDNEPLSFSKYSDYRLRTPNNLQLRSMELADMDGDADLDVVTSLNSKYGNSIIIFDNDGNGNISPSDTVVNNNSIAITDIEIADFDGDGDLDVFAIQNAEASYSYIFRNDGNGEFTKSTPGLYTEYAYRAYVIDIDNDGDVDIVSSPQYYSSKPKIFLNDGSGNFSLDSEIDAIFDEYTKIHFGDLDNDADVDLVVAGYYVGTRVFFNESNEQSGVAPADSLALVSLYQSTDGENWTNNTNWLAEGQPISSWFGVGLNQDQNRVASIALPNNGIKGLLPSAIDNLDALETLDLSNNDIEGFQSNLFALTNATSIDLSGNKLDFGDLEPVAQLATLEYANQQPIDAINEQDQIIPAGSNLTLTTTANGDANLYQWVLNGTDLTSAEGISYEIAQIDRSKMGDYTVKISNTVITDLTLESNPVEILANAVIAVAAQDAGSPLADNINAYLFSLNEVVADTVEFDGDPNINVPSAFIFPAVVLGDYLLAVESTEPFLDNDDIQIPGAIIPTFFGDVFLSSEADTLKLNGDVAIDINMETIPVVTAGDGLVSGTIDEDFPDETARLDARRRAKKRKCGLRRRRTGGRPGQDNDQFELIAYGETNDNGEFEYGFLPEGIYRFFVEYPGIPLDESAFTEFEVGEGGTSDDELVLAVFASPEGIEIEIVLGIAADYFVDLQVYPNPTSDLLTIAFEALKAEKIRMEVIDLEGRVVAERSLTGSQSKIHYDTSLLPTGQYLIRFSSEGIREPLVYRIIKN